MNNSWIKRKKLIIYLLVTSGLVELSDTIQSMTNTNTADVKATVNQIEQFKLLVLTL